MTPLLSSQLRFSYSLSFTITFTLPIQLFLPLSDYCILQLTVSYRPAISPAPSPATLYRGISSHNIPMPK